MNPLSFMQSHQVSGLEALRSAQGFNELAAREIAQKRVLDDRTALEQDNVTEIPKADEMRAEDRHGRNPARRDRERRGAPEEEVPEAEPLRAANPADGRLDLLA